MNFGIMQGRLTPSKGRGIQFFPFNEWQKEFHLGQKIGLNEIEWIFDYPHYDENPIWTESGCQQLSRIIEETGVIVKSVCFDYFMRRAFYKGLGDYNENIRFFQQVINGMRRIGATLIEVPMVDDSSVKNEKERSNALKIARDMADIASVHGITVGFETDMPPGVFRQFLEDIDHKNVAANYDSGNSSGLGYDPLEEIESLGTWIGNVHIKDRVLGNGTVSLGTGSADFEKVFSSLKKTSYHGSFILQAARGEDNNEVETIREQVSFIKKFIEKYEIEK